MTRRRHFSKPKRGQRLNERCRTTNKVTYPTEAEAHTDAKSLRKRVGPRVKPYLCHYCNLWHLGHWRPPEKRKEKPWTKKPNPEKKYPDRNNQAD